MPKFTVVLPNIRSSWNVGAIFRTCDALGFEIILTGYTARPIGKSLELIKKTSIGAEKTVNWQYFEHSTQVLATFGSNNQRKHLGIEINSDSQNIYDFLHNEFPKLGQNKKNEQKTQLEKSLQNKNQSEFEKIDCQKVENNQNQSKTQNLDKSKINTDKNPLEMEYFLWFGNEISGIETQVLAQIDHILHLPMKGSKESLNIANCVCACGYLLDFATKFDQI